MKSKDRMIDWLFWGSIIALLGTQTSLDLIWDGVPIGTRPELFALIVLGIILARKFVLWAFKITDNTRQPGWAHQLMDKAKLITIGAAGILLALKLVNPISQGFDLCKVALEVGDDCTFTTERWHRELDWSAKKAKFWKIGAFNTLKFSGYSSAEGPDKSCLTTDVQRLPPHCKSLDYRRRAAHPFEIKTQVSEGHLNGQKNLIFEYTGEARLEPISGTVATVLPFTEIPKQLTINVEEAGLQKGFTLRYRNYSCGGTRYIDDHPCHRVQIRDIEFNAMHFNNRDRVIRSTQTVTTGSYDFYKRFERWLAVSNSGAITTEHYRTALNIFNFPLKQGHFSNAKTIHFAAADFSVNLKPKNYSPMITQIAQLFELLIIAAFFTIAFSTITVGLFSGLKWAVLKNLFRLYPATILVLGSLGTLFLYQYVMGSSFKQPYPLAVLGCCFLALICIALKATGHIPQETKGIQKSMVDAAFSFPLLIMSVGLLFFSTVPAGDDPFLHVSDTDRFYYFSWAYTNIVERGQFPDHPRVQGMLLFSKPFFLYSRTFFIFLFGDGTLYAKRLQNFWIFAIPFLTILSLSLGVIRYKLSQAPQLGRSPTVILGAFVAFFGIFFMTQSLFQWAGLFGPGMSEWESWILALTGIIFFTFPLISSNPVDDRRLAMIGITLMAVSLTMRTVNLANLGIIPFAYLLVNPKLFMPNFKRAFRAFSIAGILILLHAFFIVNSDTLDATVEYLYWCIFGGSYAGGSGGNHTLSELFNPGRSIFFNHLTTYILGIYLAVVAAVGMQAKQWWTGLLFLALSGVVFTLGQIPVLKLTGYPRTLILPFYTMAIMSGAFVLKLSLGLITAKAPEGLANAALRTSST